MLPADNGDEDGVNTDLASPTARWMSDFSLSLPLFCFLYLFQWRRLTDRRLAGTRPLRATNKVVTHGSASHDSPRRGQRSLEMRQEKNDVQRH